MTDARRKRALEQALRFLESQRTAIEKTLEALVEVSSWTGDKSGVDAAGAVFADAMPLQCLRVLSESYGDHLVFHGPRRASEEGVMLIGHMDTVFPRKTFRGYRSEGDIAFGPGVLDMKGGLVVLAFALRAIESVDALGHLPVTAIVVSDEEQGSPDSTPLVRRMAAGAKAALGFESGRPRDEIVTRRKGTGSFTVNARGVSAHAGNRHEQGANAIWSLARFIDGAQQLTNYERGLTVNIGAIRGGMGKNTVPASAAADGDLRFATTDDERELRAALVKLAGQCALPRTGLEVEWGAGRPPMERTPASAALRDQYAACLRASGLGDGEMDLVGGGSDAATTSAMGIPSIDGLGPRGDGYHTLDEYIEIPTLVSKSSALVRFLLTHYWRA